VVAFSHTHYITGRVAILIVSQRNEAVDYLIFLGKSSHNLNLLSR